MRLLDLFSGRWGWSRAFAARGWECIGLDLVEPSEVPKGCQWFGINVLDLGVCQNKVCTLSGDAWDVDFIVASPPCEQFSVHGMKHFHPAPPYPVLGVALFNHTRHLCASSSVPYVIENVRAAQQFVGNAVHHCGPFYLWGNAVPPLLHKGIIKGTRITPGNTVQKMLDAGDKEAVREIRRNQQREFSARAGGASKAPALSATIPPELANCVCDYAERLLEHSPARRENQGAAE